MSVKEIISAVADGLSGLLSSKSIFSLKVAGAPLRVVRFLGHEAISAPFEFRVEVAGMELDPEVLIGRPAHLQISGFEAARHLHGIVSEAEYVGHTRHLQLYELTIVPAAHRLLHNIGVRLFQDKTTQQIVTEVLTKAGLQPDGFRFSLVESYAPRNYCVQYRETDLAFVSRLLEEDGIFYFFDHDAERHVWVMADHAKAHTPISGQPALWFNPPLGSFVQDREHIHSFRFGGRMRPGKVMLRDLNLHKPDPKAMEVEEAAKAGADLVVYDFPGEYQDPGRKGPHQGQLMAKIRLESLQATRRVGTGDSDCPRLQPGRVMMLVGHPRPELNGEYRLTQVTHSGAQPQELDQDGAGDTSYFNSFACTELKVPYRPARVTPRPVMRGLQTAIVVGPKHEDVHTDEHGRVRIQFHWDRDGAHDETSTCWVRVGQLWAGNGWGAMFIPRIGHEVLVDFLEGDPDKPIVTGRIYHGANHPPYPLPQNKTKTTIKSDSSIGGGGFNEFRFEDKKGEEEVFLHAQKDWNTKILNNHSESVGSNRSSTIGASETITVGASRKATITASETVNVGAGRTVSVGASDSTSVGAVHSVTIAAGDPPSPGGPTSYTMMDKSYSVTTGDATITIQGPDVYITAKGVISLSGSSVFITAESGDVVIQGGPTVHINPPAPPPAAVVAATAGTAAAAPPSESAEFGGFGGGSSGGGGASGSW